jgi:Flp pilus assembly pilin Flp
VVAAAQGSAMDAEAVAVPAGLAEAAVTGPRKARDRGASAVEWVIITGIVVAIVAGVGVIISKAITDKAKSACTQINTAGANGDAGTGGGNGGTGGTATGGTTGGSCG